MRLKNPDEARNFKNKLLLAQGNIDPIIKEVIKDAVLDHEHYGDQRCRQALDRTVNSFEGKVQNAYNRYIKHLTNKSLSEVLRNLADYYEQDYNSNPIHHTALGVDTNVFKRCNAQVQISILKGKGVEPGKNVTERTKQARKLIKEGLLTVTEIKKAQ